MTKTTRTVKAIEYSKRDDSTSYLVMVAHAGRNDRTGSKVHMASMTVWASGQVTLGATNCSANGHLRGSLIADVDYGFERVTCAKCGASQEAGERRNAKSITIDVVTV